MLDLALLRAEPAHLKAALARRGIGPESVDRASDLDARWSARTEVVEALRTRRRRASEEFADLRRTGDDTADLERLGRAIAAELAGAERDLAALAAARLEALAAIPNLPASDAPDASPPGEEGPPWPHGFAPLHHADLIEMLRLVHTEGDAAPGRGFVLWRGPGARLVRALVEFMLDLHVGEGGCEEVRCPALVEERQLFGSAHLPALHDKMYALDSAAGQAPLYLAPRAEPHLAAMVAGTVLRGEDLPVRFVSAGPAFRKEIGSHGRPARGLLRLHEFPTVEVYVFCRPDQAETELEWAAGAAEAVLARLEVPARRRLRPAPDLSHAAAKTVDVEVWAPGAGQWLGVAALSNFTDYQARRTATRFAGPDGRARLVHTIGGAAVAVPRLLAALLENGQQADGSVRLPEALRPYFGEAVLRPEP